MIASLRQMHTILGHPSNHALARAIRVTGCSAAAVRAALQLRCDVCESQQHPGPHLPARLRTDREFGDTAAIDLFVLADYEGNQLRFINILDLASTFGVVAMIPSKHPTIVWDHFSNTGSLLLAYPRRWIYDQGGEFEREFGQELEDLGCEPMPTAAITPQQNAVCERHGGIWKTHARRLLDEFSVKFVPEQLHRVTWLIAALPSMTAGTPPAQWVLGRGLRLPYTLLDQTGRLSLHERVARDRAFSERIAMMSAAQRSITSLRYDRALSRAVLARSRAHGADPARQLFQVGDVVYYWRGNGKAKRECAAHWHGPATVIGLQHESLWLAHRPTTVKCSKGHVRHETASGQWPLGPMLDILRAPPVPPGRDMQASEDLFMNSHPNAHVTRPAAALNSLTSPIPMSLCKEPETSVFRCQELLSDLCQIRRHPLSQCHINLQRHHFSVFQEERQRP